MKKKFKTGLCTVHNWATQLYMTTLLLHIKKGLEQEGLSQSHTVCGDELSRITLHILNSGQTIKQTSVLFVSLFSYV